LDFQKFFADKIYDFSLGVICDFSLGQVPHGLRGTTARHPFGQKIVPIFSFFLFGPAGKNFSFFFGEIYPTLCPLAQSVVIYDFSLGQVPYGF
jgi:hypothetical protein